MKRSTLHTMGSAFCFKEGKWMNLLQHASEPFILQNLETYSQKELILLAGKILDKECRGCFVMKQMKAEKKGDEERSRYCLKQCQIFMEMQKIGALLSKPHPKK